MNKHDSRKAERKNGMKVYTGTINGNNYCIVCESVGTRSGFAHKVNIFRNERSVSEARVNYINRTWESYPFQSCIFSAVNKWKAFIIDCAKAYYKDVHGLKRVSENNKGFMEYKEESCGAILEEIDKLSRFARTGKFEQEQEA